MQSGQIYMRVADAIARILKQEGGEYLIARLVCVTI